jgi:hypothetical protein
MEIFNWRKVSPPALVGKNHAQPNFFALSEINNCKSIIIKRERESVEPRIYCV